MAFPTKSLLSWSMSLLDFLLFFSLSQGRGEWSHSCVGVWTDPGQQLPLLQWQKSKQVKGHYSSPEVSIHYTVSKCYIQVSPSASSKCSRQNSWRSLSCLEGTWPRKSYKELYILILERLVWWEEDWMSVSFCPFHNTHLRQLKAEVNLSDLQKKEMWGN